MVRFTLQAIITACFIAIFAICGSVSVKNASIVFQHEVHEKQHGSLSQKISTYSYQATISTKGISIFLKELARSKFYVINIESQAIKDKNEKLDIDSIFATSGIFIEIPMNVEETHFDRKEYLGKIDYKATLSLKGIAVLLALYIFISVLILRGVAFYRMLFIGVFSGKQTLSHLLDAFLLHCNKYSQIINRIDRRSIYFVLCVSMVYLACFSIAPLLDSMVIQNGAGYSWFDSGDMQWYPAVQYWGLHGFSYPINPYLEALNENYFLGNLPNYAHLLYILMYPFAIFEYDTARYLYAAFNHICIFILFAYLYRYMKRTNTMLIFFNIIVLFFFTSFSYQLSIIRGNIPLVLCLFAVLAYIYRNNVFILSISLSILLIKYTFGIPIALAFLLCGYYRAVFIAGLIHLFAAILFAFQFDIGIIESILLPAKVGMIWASSDALGILSHIKTANSMVKKYILLTTLIAAICIWSYRIYKYKVSCKNAVISSVFISFCLFQHHPYDYVMIAACLAIVAKSYMENNDYKYFILNAAILCIFYIPLLADGHTYNRNLSTYSVGVLCYLYALYLTKRKLHG